MKQKIFRPTGGGGIDLRNRLLSFIIIPTIIKLSNLLLLLLSFTTVAQTVDFSPLYYRLRTPDGNYNESDYDVVIKAPAGYELVNDSIDDYRTFMVAEPNGNAVGTACSHPMIYKSSDDNALLLFPLLDIGAQQMQGYLEYEAHCISEGPYSEISGTFREFTKDEALKKCNADKGLIYDVKLRKPFTKAFKSNVDKYDYCIGVYLEKYLHPVIRIKILLTEDGYKEKEKHLNALLSCFYYGDSAPEAATRANEEWKQLQKWTKEQRNSNESKAINNQN